MDGLRSLPALPPASRRRSDNTRTFSPRSHLYKVCCAALSLCFVLQQPLHAGASPSGSGGGDGSAVPLPGSVPLNFIFLSSNHPSLLTSGSIPAVDIAVQKVAESGILGKYRLQYTEALDSQCNRTQALDRFHEAVRGKDGEEPQQSIAIIGAGCSVATLAVAEISHYYNLPVLSWSSAAAELSDRTKFKSNYRLAPSEKNYSPGLAALLQHYQWKQVGILTQLESLFLESQKFVIKLLPEVNIVTREFASNSDAFAVEDFFVESLDMRVFVLNMYVNHARLVLCEAFKRRMYYPRFLWITPGWYGYLWWEQGLPAGCNVTQMETVLSHSLSVVQYPVFSETEQSSLGLSTYDFRQLYGRQLYFERTSRNKTYSVDITAPLAFEAVWMLARALKVTHDKIEREEEGECSDVVGELVPLERFDYDNHKMGCLLRESLDQTNFLGISGNVSFDKSGDRVGNTVRISQYIPGEGRERIPGSGNRTMGTPLVGYGVFEKNGGNISLSVNLQANASVIWPEGEVPDGIPKLVIVSTALPLTVIYYILASAGIIFAMVCLLFNIIYRKRKIVRLTSPNLNYLIIAGAILLYLSVFFWVSPAREEMLATILCNFRIWLFSIGNTLCLAVVLSKMWRVHYIFTSPSPKRKPKPPQDWHLLIIITVLVSVDLVILLIPTAIEKSRSQGQLTESSEHRETEDELGVAQVHSYYSCYSDSQLIWLFMSYIYKFILQIAAIYFAFMSRKIRVKALNDSKEIAAIIYVTSLLLVISAFGFWIGLRYLNTSTVVFGLAQLLTATVILGLLFIPKMISLRLDPEGVNIFSHGQHNTTSASVNQSTIDMREGGHSVKLFELNNRVKELESELEKYQNGNTSLTAAYTCNTTTPTLIVPNSKLVATMEPEP